MTLRWSSFFSFLSVVLVTAACSAGCGGGSKGDDDDTTGDSGGGGGTNDSGGGGGSDATVPPGVDGSSGSDSGGGSGDAAMEAGPACTMNSMCTSKICAPTGMCAAPTCTDGAQNGDETDIDCGGSCSPCDTSKACLVPADCISGVCNTDRATVDAGADAGKGGADAGDAGDAGGTADSGASLECQAPTNTDGVKNGNETDVDCGGTGNPGCPVGDACLVRGDCTSDVCTDDVCIAPMCNDGIKNGTETDVDCGGSACPRCDDGEMCLVPGDCHDSVCKAATTGAPLTCAAPTYTDGVQNGEETDVDCGGDGTVAHACPSGDMCLVASDCQSDGCDYTKHCAIRRSCTGISSGGRYGADTCGRGGAGGVGNAEWESCCTTVDISVKEGTMTTAQTMHLDKYKVTAGRMRAFLESQNGDIRDFVQAQRAAGKIPALPISNNDPAGMTVLDPSWDQYLPTSMGGDFGETPDCDQSGWDSTKDTCDSKTNPPYAPIYTAAQNHVGPTVFKANSQTEQGCGYGLPGTHTYYLGNPDYQGGIADYSQSDYDVKPLQCVDYLTAQAFCIWDGGRLETTQEWYAAWGAAAMPWTADTADKDSRGISFSAMTPNSDLNTNYSIACSMTATDPDYFANVCANGTTSAGKPNPGVCTLNATTKMYMCTPAATYTACRFPSGNDSTVSNAALGCPAYAQPDTKHSIELADWEYSYEYPALGNDSDFAAFIAAPGRTLGRAPNDLNNKEGAADILGDTFEVSSDIIGVNTTDVNKNPVTNYSPFPTTTLPNVPQVGWSGNGSWEVHGYNHNLGGNGSYRVLDKYGKMGLRCIHPN